MTDPGIVVDASSLVEYALNDLRALPIDELLRELREDTGGPVLIPWLAVDEAQQILGDDPAALKRLEEFVGAHGVRFADAEMVKAVDLMVAGSDLSHGLAHAALLSLLTGASLATYAAPTLARAGYGMRRVLDLDEIFRDE